VIREVPDREWDELLNVHGLTDAYLSRGYVSASATLEPGEAKLLVHEARDGGVAFPLLVRPILHEPDVRDVTSPYGYGGPVGFGAVPPWKAFYADYEGWCTDNRIITTFVRFHPLLGNHREAARSMCVVPLAGTVAWRIEAGRDLLAQLAKHHQRIVHRTTDFRVVQQEFADEGIARFRALYASTMRRVGARSFYHFPDTYWEALRAGLGPKLSLAEVVDEGGRVLAAALLLMTPPWLHYHLGASTEEGRRVGANVRLFLDVAKAAQEAGFRVFHLGGGVEGAADSLLTFKRRFHPDGLLEAAVGKQIHDGTEYLRMTGNADTSGYFPRYREPG
jgi:serine/alanine adding enzyme